MMRIDLNSHILYRRHWLNPRVLLLASEQHDYFNNTLDVKTREERKKWQKKSRLYHIISVGGDSSRKFWTWTYIFFVIAFAGIVIIAANYNDENTDGM